MVKALRAALAGSGLTGREIARRANVDPAVVSRFLGDARTVRLETGERLAAAVGYEWRLVKVPGKRKGKG